MEEQINNRLFSDQLKKSIETRLVNYLLEFGGRADLARLAQKLHISKVAIFKLCKNSDVVQCSLKRGVVFLKKPSLLSGKENGHG